nr:zinc finger, CCHC-type [Tanacetum cinerariifolium]
MAVTAQNTNNTTIRLILQQEKLTGPNFMNWYRNLRVVLRSEGKLTHLEQPLILLPYHIASQAARDAYNALYDAQNENYNMHSMWKTIAELHDMLKLHEKGIPKKAKTLAVLAIREGKIQKGKSKLRGVKGKEEGKNKLAYAPKLKISPPPKRNNPAKDSVYHHRKEVGHWRRNCPFYQVKLKKRKNDSMFSSSGIFTIELYDFPNKT